MAAESNLSGTSLYSELFASEMPHRCDGAKLLKTESKIVYATMSKMMDLLVEIDGEKSSVAPEDAWKKTYPRGVEGVDDRRHHSVRGRQSATAIAIPSRSQWRSWLVNPELTVRMGRLRAWCAR